MSQLWTLIYYAGYLTIVVNCLYFPSLRHYSITSILTQHPENRSPDSASKKSSNNGRTISVRIPNHEIRSVYNGWLRSHIGVSIRAQNLDTTSKELFQAMIEGNFSKFAHELRSLVFGRTTYRIFGSKEAVYQGFLYGFFIAAAESYSPDHEWEIHIESDGGMGRLDLMMWDPNDHRAVIHEYKNKSLTQEDKKEFDQSKNKQLTTLSETGLNQIRSKEYGAIFDNRSKITEVHEYGIAFHGRHCAVVGRTMSRTRRGEPWTPTKEYSGKEDEASRAPKYQLPVPSS